MSEEAQSTNNDEMSDLFLYPRPEANIDLFTQPEDRNRAVMIGGEDNDWDAYCTGYRRAATTLVNQLTQKRTTLRRDYSIDWESQAYAVLFLYRHYLELRLKELIISYGVNLDEINNEHSLLKLWQKLRSQNGIQPEAQDIEITEKIITQFNEIDRKSEVFRYPIDKKERLTVPPMQFDLVRLKEMLGWTSQFLDSWSGSFHEYQERSIS